LTEKETAGQGIFGNSGSIKSPNCALRSLVPLGLQSGDGVARGVSEESTVTKPSSGSALNLGRDVYYKNRLEFGLDVGWLPVNIPFVFDVFLGDAYNMTPLRYTLVPVVASLRWQMDDVSGPWIFRGNWDMTFSGSFTAIPRGPESRFFSYDMGIRRNFVPRRGRIAPYFDGRVGLGNIDAKEPLGVAFAQGQNFTFTVNLGSGVRYSFNPRYSLSAGLNWMHISNLYLSEPKFLNYGINVYGPMFGLNVRLGKPRYDSSH
jgi:lipid A 3-O-deacylase PagL